MTQTAAQSTEAVNPFVVLGGVELFDWEKIVNVSVENQFDPHKKKKYDTLMKAVDNLASTFKGRDLLLDIYKTNGILRIVEGKPIDADGFVGPSMDYETVNTSHYDHRNHTISIDFDELERMVIVDEETGKRSWLSIEYVLMYLMMYAAKPTPEAPLPELKHYTNHVKAWAN